MVRPIRVEIAERRDGESVTVSVEGELDLGTIPVLEQHLDGHLDGHLDAAPTALTLDLGGVTFMDSSGLRMLIELNGRSHSEGWVLSLLSPHHEAARLVLRMTGADSALPFEDRARS
jgi:anti-sigma B factor antagonist